MLMAFAARSHAAPPPPEPTIARPSDATADSRPSLDERIDGLLYRAHWSGRSITYSDPDRGDEYGRDYWADDDGDGVSAQHEGFARFTPAQLETVHAILNARIYSQPPGHTGFSVEGFTDLDIGYAGPGAGTGILRFANSGDPMPPYDTAYAYFPDPWGSGGDAWFDQSGREPVAGNYDYLAIVHETGHTLGLRHGHENDWLDALPSSFDSLEFTVMTYRTYIGARPDSYKAGPVDFPQTYMMLDISALQYLYGADFETNAGDTTYSWGPTTGRTFVDGELAIAPADNRVFLTVWDGGGEDTYDLSNYATDLSIDLAPGAWSTLAQAQLADLNGGPNGGYARGNVANALQYQGDPRSLIENAIGGSGDDALAGNAAANRLEGGAGRDLLEGGGDDDQLAGRTGRDRLAGDRGDDVLDGGYGGDWLEGGAGCDVLIGRLGPDRFVFADVADSPWAGGRWDTIQPGRGLAAFDAPGAAPGDLIDLRAIDARSDLPGDQALGFGGPGQGHLRLLERWAGTLVCADVVGDGRVDFVLRIADGATAADAYTADDFLL
jgi:serralysin